MSVGFHSPSPILARKCYIFFLGPGQHDFVSGVSEKQFQLASSRERDGTYFYFISSSSLPDSICFICQNTEVQRV